MNNSLVDLFCHIDDFCNDFEPQWHQRMLGSNLKQRLRRRCLCVSEIMTILVIFHQNHYRNFKHFYQDYVCQHLCQEFPTLPSYSRFVEFIPSVTLPLCAYLKHCFGQCTGIGFIDSTCLHACHNRRINQHKVFKDLAARGKTSVDWFYGFKLHLVVNDRGELLNIKITAGNVDDRKPVVDLLKELFGKVFGDRGY
ncbi:MAG: IS982 family transposase, partial [Scytonema sp. CRU_2_7]|nr:IS982 family transposase [Scytonema sp. CRU_2_7]